VPIPDVQRSEVAIASPGHGDGHWAGAPSASISDDGVYLAYRLRRPVAQGRGYAVVVAHSSNGVDFNTVQVLTRDQFASDSLERPALVRLPDGRWRIYLSIATPGTLHWRIDAIDADDPAHFDPTKRVTVMPGDEDAGYKDPVIIRTGDDWRMWVCQHVIHPSGVADEMSTRLATSTDGLSWELQGDALVGRPGEWDARGARITAVLADHQPPVAYYDGRMSAKQNWEEMTGLAVESSPDTFTSVSAAPLALSPFGNGGLRYLSIIEQDGGYRLYFEVTESDGSHDLRTQYVPR